MQIGKNTVVLFRGRFKNANCGPMGRGKFNTSSRTREASRNADRMPFTDGARGPAPYHFLGQ